MTRHEQLTRVLIVIILVLATFVPRLTSLETTLTVDEPLWQGRGEQFVKALASGHFEKTLTAGQPGVTTTWLVGIARPWNSLRAGQTAVALGSSLLILTATYALTRLWGFWWGITGGLLLALDPFLIAHSRVVHTDALFSLSALVSLLFLLLTFESTSAASALPKRYLVLNAFFAGAAILSKTFGLFLIPVSLLVIIIKAYPHKPWLLTALETSILWLAVFTLTIFALWPALWVGPAEVVQFLTSRVALHSGDAAPHAGETTAEWWYYARDGLFRSTPIALIALLPGMWAALRNRDRLQRSCLALLTIGIVFAFLLSFSTDKSDRYILLSLLTLDLFAVLGLRQLQRIATHFFPRARIAVAALAITVLLGEVFALHPYYLAYHNRLYPVEARHKLGWGEGLEQAAAWINQHAPGASVASYYANVFAHWYAGPVSGLTGDSTADYLVLYRSMFERGPAHSDTDLADQYIWSGRYQPEHVIEINHLPYVWIFKNQ